MTKINEKSLIKLEDEPGKPERPNYTSACAVLALEDLNSTQPLTSDAFWSLAEGNWESINQIKDTMHYLTDCAGKEGVRELDVSFVKAHLPIGIQIPERG